MYETGGYAVTWDGGSDFIDLINHYLNKLISGRLFG